jgi:hypothetical protein
LIANDISNSRELLAMFDIAFFVDAFGEILAQAS